MIQSWKGCSSHGWANVDVYFRGPDKLAFSVCACVHQGTFVLSSHAVTQKERAYNSEKSFIQTNYKTARAESDP